MGQPGPNMIWSRSWLCTPRTPCSIRTATRSPRWDGLRCAKRSPRRWMSGPDIRFERRRGYVGSGHFVSEYEMTATQDGREVVCDGVDVFSVTDGLVARKDTYLDWAATAARLVWLVVRFCTVNDWRAVTSRQSLDELI